MFLDRVEHWWFIIVGDLSVLSASLDDLAGLAVHLQQFGHVEFWLLEDLTLADVNFMKRISGGRGFGDVGSDGVGQQFRHDGTDVRTRNLASHNVHHFFADDSDLGGLRVGGLLDLVDSSFGESDAEEAQFVSVGGGHVYVRLDLSLPLFDHGALFVAG